MKLSYVRTSRIGERMIAFIIDNFVFTAVFVGIAMSSLDIRSNYLNAIAGILFVILFCIYTFKDIVDGRSIGKRLFGIGVRKASNPNELPSKWQLLVRNLTLSMWPVEFIIMLFSQNGERLGDRLARTVVVKLDMIDEEDSSYLEEYLRNNKGRTKESRKKIVKRVVIVLVGFTMVIVLFIGSIVMMFRNSAAYDKSIEVIESSSIVYKLVGEIEGYGFIPSGSLRISGDSGSADFKIKVKGKQGDCNVYIRLVKEPGEGWRTVGFKALK